MFSCIEKPTVKSRVTCACQRCCPPAHTCVCVSIYPSICLCMRVYFASLAWVCVCVSLSLYIYIRLYVYACVSISLLDVYPLTRVGVLYKLCVCVCVCVCVRERERERERESVYLSLSLSTCWDMHTCSANKRTHATQENTLYPREHPLHKRTPSIQENTFYPREHPPSKSTQSIQENTFYTREHIVYTCRGAHVQHQSNACFFEILFFLFQVRFWGFALNSSPQIVIFKKRTWGLWREACVLRAAQHSERLVLSRGCNSLRRVSY